MRPTEEKTRENIIAAKQRKEKRGTIATWLGISISTVDKIWRRYNETGSFTATPYIGRKSSIDAETDDKIRMTINENPDLTLEELIDELSLPLTPSGLHRKLDRMGLSYKKKTLHPSAQQRQDVQEKREEWREIQPILDPKKLAFLDESSVNLAMTRLYGRAPTNERVNDYVPDVRFQRLSILSTVKLDGTQIPFVFNGTLNSELFKKYVEDFLAPTLLSGDILIMDNLSAHKAKGVLDSITERGVITLFLPTYSPDFNPIEMLWSKMKAFLRKMKARTYDSLIDAIHLALDYISPDDIAAWFKHDGYLVQ